MTLKASRKGAKAQRNPPSLLCVFAPLRETFLFAISLACFSSALAQSSVTFAPTGDETADFETKVLLTDLDNPTGLAVRPTQAKHGPYELYIAESGAGRVVRVSTDAPKKLEKVIVGFPLGVFGGEAEYTIGPVSLAFISRAKLVVGAKGEGEGDDFLASYNLPANGDSQSADEQDHSVGPLDAKITSQQLGFRTHIDCLQFAGLAISGTKCFATTGGYDSRGWVVKADIEANRLAHLRPFIEMKKKVGFGGPAGIAVIPPPRPAYLVVALVGSHETPHDCRLAYFVPATGELVMNLPTGLHDITSLAYSPSGQLYAADFSWLGGQAGSVYRIDDARIDGRQTCRAVKIASVFQPYGLAFAPDGSLFVTSFGEGKVIKITGDL